MENKIKVGDWVQIANSRTDEVAELLFKGQVVEIKIQKDGRSEGFEVAKVKSLMGHNNTQRYFSWELVDDLIVIDANKAHLWYLV